MVPSIGAGRSSYLQILIRVDASLREFRCILPSFVGGPFHDFVEGATTIVRPTSSGFRLLVRLDREAAGTASSVVELAQEWRVQWEATSPGPSTFFDRCAGKYQPAWQQHVASDGTTSPNLIFGEVMVDANCGLPDSPHYFANVTMPTGQALPVRGGGTQSICPRTRDFGCSCID